MDVCKRSLVVLVVVLCGGAVFSNAQEKRVDVKFRQGASSGVYSNTVTGYGSVDFYIRAKAGQTMSAKLTSTNKFLYFVVLKDLTSMEAVADEARDTTNWSGELPADGSYIVRVFLVRAEARRNKRPVKFSVRIGVK
ncbi:MAG TPA: hypothetical protein PLP21_17445 [Pyrinomonadaceae bacterium]|nr:hypothetical protein [Acidobacteriota bacterium]HQZ98110.1 hypothetical protein [Pyrinomonadaceae bacterium]